MDDGNDDVDSLEECGSGESINSNNSIPVLSMIGNDDESDADESDADESDDNESDDDEFQQMDGDDEYSKQLPPHFI